MIMIDRNDNTAVSTKTLFEEWKTLKETEPENHQAAFTMELLEIILATINGRNDMEITGIPAKELDRIIARLAFKANICKFSLCEV